MSMDKGMLCDSVPLKAHCLVDDRFIHEHFLSWRLSSGAFLLPCGSPQLRNIFTHRKSVRQQSFVIQEKGP